MKKKYFFKRYSNIFLVLVSLIFCIVSQAQKKAIDSTLNVLKKHLKEDSLRANALIYLSYLYQTSSLTNSEYYAKEALGIANKLNKDALECAALNQLASVYTWERKTTEALATYFQQQEIAQKTNQEYWLIKAYLGVSNVYELENEWGKAVKYTLDALKIAEKSPDPFDEEDVYNNLGAEYLGLKNDKLAEEYLRKAAALFKKDNNLDQLGDCEITLAKVFATRGNYDSAKYYFDDAVALFTSLDEPYQIADVYQHVGDMYSARGMYNQAETYYKKTILIYDKTDAAEGDYALAVIGLGTVAFGKKNYDTASLIFHNEFAKVKQANIIEPQLQCLLYMAKSDSALGNYKEALEHMQNYAVLYDGFYSQEKTRSTQRLLIELDVQQKEKENEQLKMENSLQQQHMAIFAVAGIALLIAGAFLALLYKQKTEALNSVKQMQQKTEAQKNELAIINTVKDKLISMIAHDVRSPLTSLQNTLHLTRQKILNEEEFDKLSLILDNDIRHLVSMLDNTLLWAREQIHVLKVNKIPFDLHSLAEDVLELYHQPIQDKYLSVKNNIPPSTEVISDKEIIHTALRNFISNAIKFTPLGTSIEINAEQKNGAMYITVKDEGVGISKEILNKINRKEFVSTRGTNNEKGTGLGLMFTEDLISKLGEELYIETQAGKGTAITFTIHKQDTTAS
jgi:two-component system sensor histidine kinase/response regulator